MAVLVIAGIFGAVLLAAAVLVLLVVRQAKKMPRFDSDKKDDGLTEKEKEASIRKIYTPKEVPENIDAIVIGSGIGGLATAVLLAREGKKVLVLEQHDVAGGCMHTFIDEHGFEYDTGVHYIGGKVGETKGRGTSMRRLFDVLTDGKLRWEKLADDFDIAVSRQTNEEFHTSGNMRKMIDDLCAQFPEEQGAIRTYFKMVREANASAGGYFLLKMMPRWLANVLRSVLSTPFHKFSDKTLGEVLDSLTTNKKLKGILAYPYGDHGLVPSKASFTIHAMIVGHYAGGAYYPVGGSSEIARHAVAVITKAGGKVLVRADVGEIIVDAASMTARGVRMRKNDQEILAPIVISACGALNTYKKLLAKEITQSTEELRYINTLLAPTPTEGPLYPSTGHLSLFVGMNGDPEQLKLPKSNYWVFPNWNHEESYRNYYADKNSPFGGLFISFPAAKDPTYKTRFPGKSTALVVTEANYEWFREWESERVKKRGDDYMALKDSLQSRLLEEFFVQFPHLRGSVEFVDLGTPLSNNHYLGSFRGESYGLTHTPQRFRIQHVLGPATPIRGLYLSGQDVATNGVGGALFGGFICAANISKRILWNNLNLLT